MDTVKWFFEICKVNIDIPLLLITLLQNVAQGEYVFGCSSRVVFTTLSILIIITLQNTLLGIERSVTPLQLLQSARFPFKGF